MARRLTWYNDDPASILKAVLSNGLRLFGKTVPLNIVDSFVHYITDTRIVADCGIYRVNQHLELSDWVVGEAHRLALTGGASPVTAIGKTIGTQEIALGMPKRGRSAERITIVKATRSQRGDALGKFGLLTSIMFAVDSRLKDELLQNNRRNVAGVIQNVSLASQVSDGGVSLRFRCHMTGT